MTACPDPAGTSAESGLAVTVDAAVMTVTLDRAQRRNAQTPAMWHALARVGAALPDAVRLVVVRGAGPSFSAGIDLSVLAGQAHEPPTAEVIAGYQADFTWLSRPDLVSIAVVQGHAVGAGFQLALACDLRLLATDAQLTMAETSRGLVPDLGGTKTLVDLVGYPRALEMCLTGRRVGAAEALRLGLAELVVPAAELDAAAADLTAALLAAPPGAATATKALLLAARDELRTRADQLHAERTAQVARFADLPPGAAAGGPARS